MNINKFIFHLKELAEEMWNGEGSGATKRGDGLYLWSDFHSHLGGWLFWVLNELQMIRRKRIESLLLLIWVSLTLRSIVCRRWWNFYNDGTVVYLMEIAKYLEIMGLTGRKGQKNEILLSEIEMCVC